MALQLALIKLMLILGILIDLIVLIVNSLDNLIKVR